MKFREAIEACNKALEFDEKNEKGLYRLASAYYGLAEYQQAIDNAKKLKEVCPESKEAIQMIASSKQRLLEFQQKEKAMYAKMFK